MPPVKYFEVTQTRKVKIRAPDIVTAINLADSVFKGEEPDPTLGGAAGEIRITDFSADED